MKAFFKYLFFSLLLVFFVSCEDSTIPENYFGKVSYHPGLFGLDADTTSVTKTVVFAYNEDAKNSKDSTWAQYEFVDKNGTLINAKDLEITVDGTTVLKNNQIIVNATQNELKLTFRFMPEASKGRHEGYFRLVNHNMLDRVDENVLVDSNSQVDVFKWVIVFDRRLMHPYLYYFLLFILFLLALIIAYYLYYKLKGFFAPCFPENAQIEFIPIIGFDPAIDRNFMLDSYSNITVNHGNELLLYLLHDSYINRLVISKDKNEHISQSTLDKLKYGEIITIGCDFNNNNIYSIEFIPKRNKKVKVIVWNKNNQIDIESIIDLSELCGIQPETPPHPLSNLCHIGIKGRVPQKTNDQ